MTYHHLFICFTGIDGSGKTTQALLLEKWLAARGLQSRYVWSRAEVLGMRSIFLFLGRRALGTSAREIFSDPATHRKYQSRKSDLMKNPLVRTLWSAMQRIEHLVQINRDIRRNMQNGNVIVCDRYLWDSTIDLAVLHEKPPEWLYSRLNTFMWRFVPRPTITFFMDLPPAEAMKRKNDIPSLDDVSQRSQLYRYLAGREPFTVIDGCEEAAAIHNKIADKVESYLLVSPLA